MLNRLVYQLPRDRNLLTEPLCDTCHAPIPLIRLAQPRCSGCGGPPGYDRLEWIAGAMFGALALYFGIGHPLLVRSLDAVILLTIAAIDWRHHLVFGLIVYPAILAAVVLTPTLPGLTLTSAIGGLTAGLAVFGGLYLAGRLLYRGQEPMGAGDVTIAGLVGAMAAFPQALVALFLGSIAVASIGIVALLMRRARPGTYIPYGPGLCLGGLISFFLP